MEEIISQLLARIEALEARVNDLEEKQLRTKFKPPTPEEILHEAEAIICAAKLKPLWPDERIKSICRAFHLHYDTNGWMVGKTKMKNWKAAIRQWLNREHQKQSTHVKSVTNHQQSVIDYLQQRAAGEIG